jgi:hypothetical protein
MNRPLLAAVCLCSSLAAQDVFSSFEFDELSGQFTLGTAPFDATIDNGFAQVIGVSWLDTSGSHARMIDVGQNRCRPNW